MKITIIGGGKVGTALCEQLVDEGHDIAVIDSDAHIISSLIDSIDVNAVVGNGVSAEIQKEAGVPDSDLVIACTPSDEQNILCCMVAKKLGVQRTIARVRNPEYFNLFISDDLGLNLMVNPENEASEEIARIIGFPYATKAELLAENTLLVEYKIPQDSKLSGVALRDISQKFNARVLISNVRRDDNTFVPKGDFILRDGDIIYITAAVDELYKLFRNAQVALGRNRHVYVLGGGRIAFYLAKQLRSKNFKVTVIERNADVCNKLDEMLDGVRIINADGFNQRVLKEEDVENADSVVALSDDDEKNILISMFVKSIGKKAIVKVDKTEYIDMLENVGINSIVSPKHLTANQIVRFVRSMHTGKGGSVCSVYRMLASGVEYVEFEVGKDFKYEDVELRNLRLKKGIIIVSITHNGKTVVPNGLNAVKKGDRVVIASLSKGMDSFNEVFE
ncbi:MAG: Trk system potassium transporter TrkA [Corallococcus sp.]|nr:Trk system potassium transporter TrkA [Corallococcus sp.]